MNTFEDKLWSQNSLVCVIVFVLCMPDISSEYIELKLATLATCTKVINTKKKTQYRINLSLARIVYFSYLFIQKVISYSENFLKITFWFAQCLLLCI